MEKAQAVLEVVMAHAINAAQRARTEAAASSDKGLEGMSFAYYDITDIIREQADLLGIEWEDRTLADFEPDSLLWNPRKEGV